MTEAGMRSIFRYHRATSGAARVRPHRLRHTYVISPAFRAVRDMISAA
jgi:integrase